MANDQHLLAPREYAAYLTTLTTQDLTGRMAQRFTDVATLLTAFVDPETTFDDVLLCAEAALETLAAALEGIDFGDSRPQTFDAFLRAREQNVDGFNPRVWATATHPAEVVVQAVGHEVDFVVVLVEDFLTHANHPLDDPWWTKEIRALFRFYRRADRLLGVDEALVWEHFLDLCSATMVSLWEDQRRQIATAQNRLRHLVWFKK